MSKERYSIPYIDLCYNYVNYITFNCLYGETYSYLYIHCYLISSLFVSSPVGKHLHLAYFKPRLVPIATNFDCHHRLHISSVVLKDSC